MKTRAAVAKQLSISKARIALRTFCRVCDEQNPQALAAVVSDIPNTLLSIAKIDQWFRQYEAVLKTRLVP